MSHYFLYSQSFYEKFISFLIQLFLLSNLVYKIHLYLATQICLVTLYNKINWLTLVNNISKHELRMNNNSTAFICLS